MTRFNLRRIVQPKLNTQTANTPRNQTVAIGGGRLTLVAALQAHDTRGNSLSQLHLILLLPLHINQHISK